MRTLFSALLALGFAASAFAEDDKKLVREVELKDAKLVFTKGAKPGEPVKITSKRELANAVEDKETADAIAKAVDFSKEYALIFNWSGSGGDKLGATAEKDAVVFTMTRGRTKDLRMHGHVFAIAKDAKWSMAK